MSTQQNQINAYVLTLTGYGIKPSLAKAAAKDLANGLTGATSANLAKVYKHLNSQS